MSVIEQAAKRLEELRRAGIDISDVAEKNASRGRARNVAEAAVVLATPRAAEPASAVTNPVTSRHSSAARTYVQLDLANLAMAGFVTPDIPRSRIADEFRIIKRPLIANASGKSAMPIRNGNLIMVTSAVPGEGKTFSAINLAMSLAMELDQTVLLVDADEIGRAHV